MQKRYLASTRTACLGGILNEPADPDSWRLISDLGGTASDGALVQPPVGEVD